VRSERPERAVGTPATCFINRDIAIASRFIPPSYASSLTFEGASNTIYKRSRIDAMKGHSNEEERGALDYARHHGLCEQYDSGPIYDGSIPVPSNDTIDLDLWDPSNEFIANAVDMLTRERLAVSREAVLLLRAVHELQQKAVDEPLATDRYHWMSNLKQELPILRTDNELDLLHFGSAVMPDLKDSNIPLEIVDQEKDEGLEWPAKYLTYPAQFDKQIKAEKLAVSRDVLLHLCDAIADAYTSEDYERIQQENLQYKPVGEVSMPEDITKSIEYGSSACHPTFTATVTTSDAIHTIISSQSSPTSFR
jgi:hypothetical protein